MEVLNTIFVLPFLDMADSPIFFAEVVVSGLLTGVLYSLVALGFVLIFKASGVFNFAQGAMVLFAALTLVGLMKAGLPLWAALALGLGGAYSLIKNLQQGSRNGVLLSGAVIALAIVGSFPGLPIWMALIITAGLMVVLAVAIEKLVLRPLVNQPDIILFMATIGITFILEGFGETVWGSDIHRLDVGIPDVPIDVAGMLLSTFDMWAAAIGAAMVAGLALFFRYTVIGRALRAVADDHQAALSVGIPLKTIWIVVWSVAGIVGLVAGIMWGTKSGVQFSLSLIALKALPVLILGGFTSIPGAIVGGLIIGVGEKVAEIYWGPLVGGAIENWFAYMLALVFLLFRPQGLFGEKIIERV